MPKKIGKYYLARITKPPRISQDALMDAIVSAVTLRLGKFSWAITDILDRRTETIPFIYGRLAKFQPQGQITIVDTANRLQAEAEVTHLLIATSPFVYLPTFSGIAYLHVWNQIQEDTFARRLKAILEATFLHFFFECDIEPISDYRAFSARIRELTTITEISAKVHPPNPLFGRLWEPLRDYLKVRNASEVRVKETNETGSGLNTALSELIQRILDNPNYQPDAPPAIGDSALLMAADGYGTGKVCGIRDDQLIVIQTADTQKSFSFSPSPNPEDLADIAATHFRRVSDDRGLHHS